MQVDKSELVARPRENLVSLQCGRGLAALMVVTYHTSVIFRLPNYWNARPFGDLPRFLDSGVDFFFVLSGFIILHAHARDLGDAGRIGSFIRKRVVRVYPIFWIVFGLMLAPFLFLDGALPLSRVVREVLLLPSSGTIPDQKIVTVSWTLCYEIAFYAVFAVSILSRSLGAIVAAAWIVASFYSIKQPDPAQWNVLESPYNVLFFIGMAVRQIWDANRLRVPLTPLGWAGFCLFGLAAVNRVAPFGLPAGAMHWLYGFGMGALILVAVETERKRRIAFPHFLKRLGDASYSIYLTHFAVLSILAKVLSRHKVEAVPAIVGLFILLVVIAVLVGLIVHDRVEKPLLAMLNRRAANRRVSEIGAA